MQEVYSYFTTYKYVNIQNKCIDIQKVYQLHQYFKEVYQYLYEVFRTKLIYESSLCLRTFCIFYTDPWENRLYASEGYLNKQN